MPAEDGVGLNEWRELPPKRKAGADGTLANDRPIRSAVMGRRQERTPLTDDERDGIVLAANSAFRKLKNLYAKIVPIFEDFGFKPPSADVTARDLSEKIETAIR